MLTDLALLRLMQLVSPGLPIGMYSYSQGLESAVEEGWVTNAEQAEEWLSGLLHQCLMRVDLPLAARLYDAWLLEDRQAVEHWTAMLLACRESSELRDEDRQTGQALARLLSDMQIETAKPWVRHADTTLAAMFALASVRWSVPKKQVLTGYCWGWLENQVLCAVKLVPLGQVAGQRLLYALAETIPDIIDRSLRLMDNEIGGSVFALALAGSRHEMQYSRLFRS